MAKGARLKPPMHGTGATAYERYYTAKALEQELKNKVRQGQLIEADLIETRWSRLVTAAAMAMQTMVGTVIQRGKPIPGMPGYVAIREEDLQASVDDALQRLSERKAGT